jgi:hypothetical protein
MWLVEWLEWLEHLPSKREALSSELSASKKKKERKKEKM